MKLIQPLYFDEALRRAMLVKPEKKVKPAAKEKSQPWKGK